MVRKNLNIPKEIDAQISAYCKSMNMTYTAFLILASTEYLKKDIINERLTELFFSTFKNKLDGENIKSKT